MRAMFAENRERGGVGIIACVYSIGRCISGRADLPLTDHDFLPARRIGTLNHVAFLHCATSVPCVLAVGCFSTRSFQAVFPPFSAVILHVSMLNGKVDRAEPSIQRECDDTFLRVTERDQVILYKLGEMMCKETLALLQDGLRHIKGFVGVLDRWVEMQKGNGSSEKKEDKKDYDFGEP